MKRRPAGTAPRRKPALSTSEIANVAKGVSPEVASRKKRSLPQQTSATTKEFAVCACGGSHGHNGNADACTSTSLMATLQLLDPLLQFLTKATGLPVVAAPTVHRTIPASALLKLYRASESSSQETNAKVDQVLQLHLAILCRYRILHATSMQEQQPLDSESSHWYNKAGSKRKCEAVTNEEHTVLDVCSQSWLDASWGLGFPPPVAQSPAAVAPHNLHGSTLAAARRRLAALKQRLDVVATMTPCTCGVSDSGPSDKPMVTPMPVTLSRPCDGDSAKTNHDVEASVATNEEVSLEPPLLLRSKVNESQFVPGDAIHTVVMTTPLTMRDETHATSDDDKMSEQEGQARHALHQVFGFVSSTSLSRIPSICQATATLDSATARADAPIVPQHSLLLPNSILPLQASYAGSIASNEARYANFAPHWQEYIPPALLRALSISHAADDNDASISSDSTLPHTSRLFAHQVTAIEAALSGQHCSVCTGTGSGKSLCFLIPALTAAYRDNATSLILFPTKALAQDQLSKLQVVLAQASSSHDAALVDLAERIRPATLDGDTSHAARGRIGATANVIFTNPDTLHAAILPFWRTSTYQRLLETLRYVVLDEAHTYQGIFGAHVALVVRRLVRVCAVAKANGMDRTEGSAPHTNATSRPVPASSAHNTGIVQNQGDAGIVFLTASATLSWPEEHFRRLCPIDAKIPLSILTSNEDGSPRSAKHFFVWNPPVLQQDGTPTDRVTFSCHHGSLDSSGPAGVERPTTVSPGEEQIEDDLNDSECSVKSATVTMADTVDEREAKVGTAFDSTVLAPEFEHRQQKPYNVAFHRRHAAEESARLLARAVINGVRVIAFCKTRNLVEWVYSKALEVLNSNPRTSALSSKLESYRGGYSLQERRIIEERLFSNQVLGVVGTNALELGVDIGGIDLTLHCGYPSSHASLLQQAGRAGRGKDLFAMPSLSVVICFNSPSEQQIWRKPSSLFGKGLSASNMIPLCVDLVQSHLLCASEEFPLCGQHPVTVLFDRSSATVPSDASLFGITEYDEAIAGLKSTNAVMEESVNLTNSIGSIAVLKARPSMRKAWSRVSIRSIEPIQFSIVDLSHREQKGLMDGIHSAAAVLDTIPYSRVFYHAHPGAIITHRARKYVIVSMATPPTFAASNFSCTRSLSLAAYVKPTKARYFTRPLSKTLISRLSSLETVELREEIPTKQLDESGREVERSERVTAFAGCGAVNVKRQVRGYKKLSPVNFQMISKHELSLPPIEYDTFGLYICTDPASLTERLGDKYGPGVHALSHAILAVAPLFAEGVMQGDLECDHSFFAPTQIILFDERAGGSGCTQRLWQCFFRPNSILEAAIQLLKDCSSCQIDSRYDGGCPACLHLSNCLKFNMHLSRSAAVVIGERMLERCKLTVMYQRACDMTPVKAQATMDTTPRRKSRIQAMQQAKEMHGARQRQFVVARPSWPLDGQGKRQEFG